MRINSILISIFILTIIFPFNSFADDSTVVTVGPGIRYHSVYKNSVGPYNIKILEIDIKNPKNKINTVLAKDVLGTGFEKTSSMAKRSSRSGHVVIGAVNADFFGIGDPYNPYTFLIGSMIASNEYAFGRTSPRPCFAVDTLKRLIIDDISFQAYVKTKKGYIRTINGLNDTVRTNNLVIYNKYFGNSTKTNNEVTEIKLQRLTSLIIGDTIKFLVKSKNIGVGNMTFAPDEYVLSGNGTMKTFLDTSIFVNDTISLIFNTNPFRGNVFSMTGGGPTLIINGTIPSGLQTAVHPRTAVGFNRDSSKVFFVTVDGRQPGFSVGMSLPELANYMLSIGCWNAVNLDGGGSTTMVVRNRVVNSPSDAAGERSVANALLAISEIYAKDVIDSFYLWPRQIFIDSTQSKKIEIYGKDIWGYEIDVLPTEVQWTVQGIQGFVDSLGFFYPRSVGTGILIGRIKNLADTISITVTGERIPTWSFSASGNNLPSWLSPTASTERGLAYGFVNNNHRVYVVARPNVLILDAQSGDVVGNLNISGISGGTFTLNDVEVTEDGKIIAANLTTSASTSPFKVYKWDNENSIPETIIQYSGGAYRLGDKITVVGSWSDNSAIIYAGVANSNRILKWTMSNGSFNQTPQEIILSDISNYGTNPSVAPITKGNSNFFVNATGILPKYYSPTGTILGTAPSGTVATQSNAIRYFEKSGRKFLVTYQYGAFNENARILEITNGIQNARIYETTPTLGSNANNIGLSGDVAVRHYRGNVFIVYVLATNNGIGAYQITIDTTTNVENNSSIVNDFFLTQNFPNPFNATTKFRFGVPNQSFVNISIYDCLGRKILEPVNEIKDAGIYEVEISKSNFNQELSSGIYFYQLKSGNLKITKKFVVLK
ncbi:MAG: DUF4623 domain-containing protein [Ignavibacteria bacterium]|nr:DUF4623 domain-containing protein [Ignavibacteria bacterium]